MTPRLSGHFSIFGFIFFVLKSSWELRDNGFVKIWNFDPKASDSSQNFKISNVGYSVDLAQVDCVSAEGARGTLAKRAKASDELLCCTYNSAYDSKL